ncbi:MAG: fused signal recognition particle receptor [Candidatus Marinimicrobia bacterium]|jgi:fused signal recognition particle receptor|nr:fused signal recognition particle receptor [Candidatus Neomarinimicrobiota bacterium]
MIFFKKKGAGSRENSAGSQQAKEEKFDAGLKRSRNRFREGLLSFVGKEIKIDREFLDEIEAFLYQSDFGSRVTDSLLQKIEERSRKSPVTHYEQIQVIIRDTFRERFAGNDAKIPVENHHPFVLLVVGVNGSGKTTTLGKLAYTFAQEGKKSLIIAGDTYRAAAVEQLETWAQRAGASFIKSPDAKNPSGIIYDGIQKGLHDQSDLILIDTAGRLHNKAHLMEELRKIIRVIQKLIPDAPHENLLVLDGTVGQNGLIQAREFGKILPISGLVVTKLDGTAKGGVLAAIHEEMGVPVKFVGLGEKIDDLLPFDADLYVDSLFGTRN